MAISFFHPQTPQDMEMVRVAQENFRDLVFGLLSDRREREKYVQVRLGDEVERKVRLGCT